MSISYTHVLSFAVLAACSLAPTMVVRAADEPEKAAAAAQEDPAMKEELAYITALVEAGMPDFAEPVIAAAKAKWPQLGPKLKVLELQGALRMGKFEEVDKALAAMKKGSAEYWALSLSKADIYYARAMMPECRKIYEEFFKTVTKPGPDLMDFYVESGFKWAQICIGLRTPEGYDAAVKMYAGLLEQIPESGATEERWCTVAMEAVSLLVRRVEDIEIPADPKKAKALTDKRNAYLAQATKIVNKLLWKNELILVFGKAVALKAHIELLSGNLEKAESLVNSYMPKLAEIHKSLREQDPDGREGYMRISPMPECRYLLAQVMWGAIQNEMKQTKPDLKGKVADLLFGPKKSNGKRSNSGAYNHAINVFVNYPEASCAGNAGELATTIEKFVKAKFGKEIKTNVTPAQKARVRKMQFQNAYENYRNGEFEKAAKNYSDVLVQYPEVEESIGAVSTLAECYLNLWDVEKNPGKKLEWRLSASAAEGYLAERFSDLKKDFIRPAGDQILRLAAKEGELGEKARVAELYEEFFHHFPTHYNAAQTALTLADRAFQKEDWSEAARYYGVVATSFTNSSHFARSVFALSTCAEKQNDREGQKHWMGEYSKIAPTVSARTSTQLKLALMQQKDAFSAFADAAQTNDVDVVTATRKQATKDVIGAVRNFNGVATELAAELERNKGLSAKEKEGYNTLRQQAMFLAGDSFQQLSKWVEERQRAACGTKAVAAYEKYLGAYPTGMYGAPVLMKIASIQTAAKNTEGAKDAFARLQKNFPDSDEAKNSVPRFAQELIKLGRYDEGVAQYKLMLETKGGKYTAGQFLQAGNALLEAKSWDVAGEAYARAEELSEEMTNKSAQSNIVAFATLGQAEVYVGQKQYVQARQTLDKFVGKYPKSTLVLRAYEMLVEVASIEGGNAKDDEERVSLFNVAVKAVKKIRQFKEPKERAAKKAYEVAAAAENPNEAQVAQLKAAWMPLRDELDKLDLRSGDVVVRKIVAEESMGLKEQALESSRKAIVQFQTFLMSHEPTEALPFEAMSAAEQENLERCYYTVLPLMAKLGEEQTEKIREYGTTYLKCFDAQDEDEARKCKIKVDAAHKTTVRGLVNQAKGE